MTATLFEAHPDPDCRWCNGHGYWIEYRHGMDPEKYPRHKCSCTKRSTDRES